MKRVKVCHDEPASWNARIPLDRVSVGSARNQSVAYSVRPVALTVEALGR